ncbi:MAG: DUF5518 domain-containing protein [Methanobacterium sp.]|nr:DUF5518 domain-containing protein [Methanobacterium sp.]
MLDYLEILLGVIFTLIISMILGLISGGLGSYAGFLIVAIWVGYRVNLNVTNGALNGGVTAILAGFLSALIMVSMGALLHMGPGMDILSFGIFGIIIGLMVDGLIGAAGGTVGYYLSIR